MDLESFTALTRFSGSRSDDRFGREVLVLAQVHQTKVVKTLSRQDWVNDVTGWSRDSGRTLPHRPRVISRPAGNFVLTNDPEDPHLAVANGLNQRFLA